MIDMSLPCPTFSGSVGIIIFSAIRFCRPCSTRPCQSFLTMPTLTNTIGTRKRPAGHHHLSQERHVGPRPLYTKLDKCVLCEGGLPLSDLPGGIHASVWNGAEWVQVFHGTKKCRSYGGCGKYYKLNFISEHGLGPTLSQHIQFFTSLNIP